MNLLIIIAPDSESKLNNVKLTLEIIEDLDASIFMSLTKAEEINAEITEAGNYSESVNEVLLKIEDVIQKNKPQPQQIPNVNNVPIVEGAGVSAGPSITAGLTRNSSSLCSKVIVETLQSSCPSGIPFQQLSTKIRLSRISIK